ncbi:hypothetical protein V2J09_007113 [Rumex salicifolius]
MNFPPSPPLPSTASNPSSPTPGVPPEPSDIPMSWSEKVSDERKKTNSPLVKDALCKARKIKISYPEGTDVIPHVHINREVMHSLYSAWSTSVILKVLGKPVSYAVMEKRVRQMWNLKGRMTLIDLPNHYYVARFEWEEDFLYALTQGLWMIFGNYIATCGVYGHLIDKFPQPAPAKVHVEPKPRCVLVKNRRRHQPWRRNNVRQPKERRGQNVSKNPGPTPGVFSNNSFEDLENLEENGKIDVENIVVANITQEISIPTNKDIP